MGRDLRLRDLLDVGNNCRTSRSGLHIVFWRLYKKLDEQIKKFVCFEHRWKHLKVVSSFAKYTVETAEKNMELPSSATRFTINDGQKFTNISFQKLYIGTSSNIIEWQDICTYDQPYYLAVQWLTQTKFKLWIELYAKWQYDIYLYEIFLEILVLEFRKSF